MSSVKSNPVLFFFEGGSQYREIGRRILDLLCLNRLRWMKGRRQCRAINFKRQQAASQGLVKIYIDYIMVDSFNIPVVHTLILLMVKKNCNVKYTRLFLIILLSKLCNCLYSLYICRLEWCLTNLVSNYLTLSVSYCIFQNISTDNTIYIVNSWHIVTSCFL